MTKPDSWTRKSSLHIADCRVFKVREDACIRESDGKEASFYVIESPDWVNVIALTKEKEVVLIDQYRYGTESVITEIPGGMIDTAELPEAAARRELLEETSFSSDRWIFLGRSHSNPAIQNNTIFHYAALDCVETAETDFDEHEKISTSLVPLSRVNEMIEDGTITHSLVVAAFFYLGQRFGEL